MHIARRIVPARPVTSSIAADSGNSRGFYRGGSTRLWHREQAHGARVVHRRAGRDIAIGRWCRRQGGDVRTLSWLCPTVVGKVSEGWTRAAHCDCAWSRRVATTRRDRLPCGKRWPEPGRHHGRDRQHTATNGQPSTHRVPPSVTPVACQKECARPRPKVSSHRCKRLCRWPQPSAWRISMPLAGRLTMRRGTGDRQSSLIASVRS
jgi:hypothetical protein